MACGFFHFWGTEWLVGYQTFFFSLLGFYAVWVMDSDHLLIYLGLAIFNWFCVSGHLSMLGYGTALVDVTTPLCEEYFLSISSGRCKGYVDFLRFLGLISIFFQTSSVYLSWRAYKLSLIRGPTSFYESIPEIKPELKFAGPYQPTPMNFGGGGAGGGVNEVPTDVH
eukprot:TRINITY_DN3498_c0_g1_i1.p1 TRINITY_DN3498_c0_g1~~TRINITY_DN3498_c0_g1_i1.p1  ORF type:complete len:167 (+),score=27.89 TRINITY_DN3498_c0_g1_i1:327-827(+)